MTVLIDTEAWFAPAVALEPSVRNAAPADAHAIAAIGRVAVPETYRDVIGDASVMAAIVEQSYAPGALRDCIARCAGAEGAHFLVAEQAGRVVGFLHYRLCRVAAGRSRSQPVRSARKLRESYPAPPGAYVSTS